MPDIRHLSIISNRNCFSCRHESMIFCGLHVSISYSHSLPFLPSLPIILICPLLLPCPLPQTLISFSAYNKRLGDKSSIVHIDSAIGYDIFWIYFKNERSVAKRPRMAVDRAGHGCGRGHPSTIRGSGVLPPGHFRNYCRRQYVYFAMYK